MALLIPLAGMGLKTSAAGCNLTGTS